MPLSVGLEIEYNPIQARHEFPLWRVEGACPSHFLPGFAFAGVLSRCISPELHEASESEDQHESGVLPLTMDSSGFSELWKLFAPEVECEETAVSSAVYSEAGKIEERILCAGREFGSGFLRIAVDKWLLNPLAPANPSVSSCEDEDSYAMLRFCTGKKVEFTIEEDSIDGGYEPQRRKSDSKGRLLRA